MIIRSSAMRQPAMLAFSLLMMVQGLPAETSMHPKLVSKEKTINSVALLPPTALMKVHSFAGYDFKEKEADQLASALAGVVSSAFKKGPWQVNDTAFTGDALQGRDELKYLVVYLRTRHQRLVEQIYPKDVKKGRYSLGERVAALNSQVPADALVLVHGDGERFTTGAVVGGNIMGVLINGPFAPITWTVWTKDVPLRISLVDSQTGEVLCFVKTSSAEEESILKELRKVWLLMF